MADRILNVPFALKSLDTISKFSSIQKLFTKTSELLHSSTSPLPLNVAFKRLNKTFSVVLRCQ
jgi:hypothetical protein